MGLRQLGGSAGVMNPSEVVEGATQIWYGDSYNAARGNPYPLRLPVDRVSSRCRAATVTNRAVIGWQAQDAVSYAFGTFTAANGSGSTVAGTYANSAFPAGLVFLPLGRNDAGKDGISTHSDTTASRRASFFNSLHSLVRLARASARTEDTAGAFAYTGTWTHASGNNNMSSGTWSYSTTNGDKMTITTPSGTDFDVALIGFSPGCALLGAAFTITVDGNPYVPPYGPTTTAGQECYNTGSATAGYAQLCIPFHGLSNQAHTIVITHAGTNGQYLGVDCLLQQSATPPTIVIPKMVQISAAGYTTYGAGASWATDQIYNTAISTLISDLGISDNSVITCDPNPAGWNLSTMMSTEDGTGVHHNDAGAAFQADIYMTAINALPAREGLVIV